MRPLQGHLSQRTISALMDGELDLLRVREARLHISRCEGCRLELQEMEEIDVRILVARGGGRPRAGLLAGLLPVVREGRPEQRAASRPVVALVAIALAVVATAKLTWPWGAADPVRKEVVRGLPPAEPLRPLRVALEKEGGDLPMQAPELVEAAPAATRGGEASPVPVIPSLEFVVTRIRPPDPPPPAPEPSGGGEEIALNPPPPANVHQEAESPPPPGGLDGSGGPVEVGTEASQGVGVPQWILASIPVEEQLEEAPELRLRIPGSRPRDLASRWPSSSEERVGNTFSGAFEYPPRP